METQLNQYYRSVYRRLPCDRKMKAKILGRIKEAVNGYLEEHPTADMDAIQAHFGTPERIAEAYIEEMTMSEIIKKFRVKKWAVTVIAVVAAVTVVAYLVVLGAAYAKEKDSADGYYEVDPIVEMG